MYWYWKHSAELKDNNLDFIKIIELTQVCKFMGSIIGCIKLDYAIYLLHLSDIYSAVRSKHSTLLAWTRGVFGWSDICTCLQLVINMKSLFFSGVRVARSLVFYVVFFIIFCPFVLFLLAVLLSVLRFTSSGIFKPFFKVLVK